MEIQIKLDLYENGFHQKVAHYKKDKIHLTVAPHLHGFENEAITGWDVYFWKDKDGVADTSKPIDSSVVDGGPEDLEEIADTYARRLEAGVPVSEMFRDIEEEREKWMRELSEKIKSEKR